MPRHNTLTDPNLHEPKGVASAASGQMYVADGAGSGAWVYSPTGWGYYKDDNTEQTFNTTAAKLVISGADASSTSLYLPKQIRGTGELWDVTNNLVTPIAVGDAYNIRLDLPITARTDALVAEVQLDIGGGSSPSIVPITTYFDPTTSTPFDLSLNFNISVESTLLSNGAQFFITTDTGSIGITAPSITVTRTHGEI